MLVEKNTLSKKLKHCVAREEISNSGEIMRGSNSGALFLGTLSVGHRMKGPTS